LLPVHPATTLQNVPPYPPRSIGVTGGDSQATVTWVGPINTGGSPITSYKVVPYKGTTVLPALTYAANATSGTVTSLTNGDTFTFKVFATNAVGNGMLSTPTRAVTIGTPSAPPSVSATPGDGNAIVGWSLPTNTNGAAISGYRVTPRRGVVTLAPVTFPAGARSGAVPGLTNSTTYTFTVAALNARGAGAPTITPTVIVGTPTAPTGVGATSGPGSGAITVHWSPPTSTNGAAITGYVITTRYKGKPLGTKTAAATAGAVTISGLTSGTSYSFVVNATNARGTGAQSPSTPETVAP
jgi:titin